MTEADKNWWMGNAIFSACMAIPLLGCVLAVYFNNMDWLILLAPLCILMEGAFLLMPLAWFIVACILGR